MITENSIRQKLQNEINTFIKSIPDEHPRDRMYFIFCGDGKIQNWGSLARGTLLLLLSGESENSSILLARAVEMLHHASLLVDDQIDKAHTRRGKTAFWIKYGFDECILFSHRMVAMAIKDLVLFDSNYNSVGSAQKYALEAMCQMADAELEARRTYPTDLETYLRCAHRKTGSLYGLVSQLAGLIPTTIISDKDSCLSALQMVGISHQMLDDFLDSDPTQSENNIFASDSAEKRNCSHSIYQLLKYGFTLDQLKKFHKLYGYKAIQLLESSLFNAPERQVIINLCEKICFGASSIESFSKEKIRGENDVDIH
ncbi:polyprenyl synthetase family protein, partial [bacterium]|nr:polyprenyl synthetase family protein [bacterium]